MSMEILMQCTDNIKLITKCLDGDVDHLMVLDRKRLRAERQEWISVYESELKKLETTIRHLIEDLLRSRKFKKLFFRMKIDDLGP